METAAGSDVGDTGVKALASNKENVPEAVANRRSSLAPWGSVGATPSKLQDLAKRCVGSRRVTRLQAAPAGGGPKRPYNGKHLSGGRPAALLGPHRRLSRPAGCHDVWPPV